jgi:hypothetical protein
VGAPPKLLFADHSVVATLTERRLGDDGSDPSVTWEMTAPTDFSPAPTLYRPLLKGAWRQATRESRLSRGIAY